MLKHNMGRTPAVSRGNPQQCHRSAISWENTPQHLRGVYSVLRSIGDFLCQIVSNVSRAAIHTWSSVPVVTNHLMTHSFLRKLQCVPSKDLSQRT